jgi:dTDP-4-dehydrorhamnose reductase
LKILLLGANGQVGFALRRSLASLGSLVCASRDGDLGDGLVGEVADLSNPQSMLSMLDRIRPEVIVNAAAYTAVDRAEDEEALAHTVNADAVAVLGQWAATTKALVVHYSTDYVFNGQGQRPYLENDATDPLGAYGRSKLAGEDALRESGATYLIFRTAWVYAAQGKNFLSTMLRMGSERDELRVVADQVGAPSSAGMIAEATASALQRWIGAADSSRLLLTGTYNLVSSGQTSWHGFASAIFKSATEQALIARTPVVLAIATADFPTRARRPAYSVLDNTRFQKTFDFALPAWQSSLDEVMLEVLEIR